MLRLFIIRGNLHRYPFITLFKRPFIQHFEINRIKGLNGFGTRKETCSIFRGGLIFVINDLLRNFTIAAGVGVGGINENFSLQGTYFFGHLAILFKGSSQQYHFSKICGLFWCACFSSDGIGHFLQFIRVSRTEHYFMPGLCPMFS